MFEEYRRHVRDTNGGVDGTSGADERKAQFVEGN